MLCATDIVARGIDIDDISIVINFDVPHDSEDYVHRIGRTARADRDGKAITFVSERDIRRFKQIEDFLGKEIEKLSLPEGLGQGPEYKAPKAKAGAGRGRGRGRGTGRRRGQHPPKANAAKGSAVGANSQDTASAPKKKSNRRRKPGGKGESNGDSLTKNS